MVRGALELVWPGDAQSPRSGVIVENVAAILSLMRCKDPRGYPSILKSTSAVKNKKNDSQSKYLRMP